MEKEKWFRVLLRLIYIISDEVYQKRVWVDALGPEVTSYGETRCILFDDYAFEDFIELETSNPSFNEKIIEGFRKIAIELDNFRPDNNHTDEEIIEMSGWKSIRSTAKEILKICNTSTEKEYLKEINNPILDELDESNIPLKDY